MFILPSMLKVYGDNSWCGVRVGSQTWPEGGRSKPKFLLGFNWIPKFQFKLSV